MIFSFLKDDGSVVTSFKFTELVQDSLRPHLTKLGDPVRVSY